MAKITKIAKIACNSLRYDIQTSTQNFYADGILVHNSMIRPIPLPGGGYALGTKMGITDVSAQPQNWIQHQSNYQKFIQDLLDQNWVPLFEWCSRQNRIVIDHPRDRLVLLAVRNRVSGEYMPLRMMWDLAVDYGVEAVQTYSGNADSMQHLIEQTRGLQDQEGWVICFENGYKLKIKADLYVNIHRAKEHILRENAVVQMVLNDELDDVKSHLPDSDRWCLSEFETAFWKGISKTAMSWQQEFAHIKQLYGSDRKSFALGAAQNLPSYLRSAVFQSWEDSQPDWHKLVCDVLRKHTHTQTKLDQVRQLWGGVKWQCQTQDLDS